MENLIVFEVETIYKSGRKRVDTIVSANEDAMWKYYDKHHDNKRIAASFITDAYCA